uniref:PAK4-inhibitor INKA2 n=1 Tax=Gasterosteus aculeatus TaxID=69293 RepID=G3NS18_GASAC
ITSFSGDISCFFSRSHDRGLFNLCMKEAGDGLHAQMNSMMGALQELKLLQVQTALENLDVSGRPVNRGLARPAPPAASAPAASTSFEGQGSCFGQSEGLSPSPMQSASPSLESRNAFCRGDRTLPRNRSSVGTSSSSASSLETDDAGDWTSSLMSRVRNRQPLVLGDNVFADLVGNWLDLPEVEREEGGEEEARKRIEDGGADRPDTPAHPLRLSRSQEICKKFSLTTNIFKKFLRGVRPDRDKLLKERPGWMAPELPEGDLLKRPKKGAPKSSKGSFYLPFWASGQQRHPETGLEKMQPLFDYNTAVWV